MTSSWRNRLYGFAARVLPRTKKHYIMLCVLLALFGFLSLGAVGLILSFWTMLMWFSIWKRPYHFELLLIAILGLLGAGFILPFREWFEGNYYFMVVFVALGLSPLLEVTFKLLLPKGS